MEMICFLQMQANPNVTMKLGFPRFAKEEILWIWFSNFATFRKKDLDKISS